MPNNDIMISFSESVRPASVPRFIAAQTMLIWEHSTVLTASFFGQGALLMAASPLVSTASRASVSPVAWPVATRFRLALPTASEIHALGPESITRLAASHELPKYWFHLEMVSAISWT